MDAIDPFVMQLLIVSAVVIGAGALAAVLAKKVFVGPLVALLLNMAYEAWYMLSYYPGLGVSFTSWNIFFPLAALLLSWIAVNVRRQVDEVKELDPM